MINQAWWAAALAGVFACTGSIDDPIQRRGREGIPDQRPNTPDARRCDTPGPGAHPLVRLTQAQYLAMIERVFPGVSYERPALPEVVAANAGYGNDATLAAPIDDAVYAYYEAAQTISAAAVEQRGWMACELDAEGCVQGTLRGLASALFRAALSDEEGAAIDAFVTAELEALGAAETLRVGIQALLESPSFLYVPESGDAALDAPEGLVALSAGELANRMALFLWDEPADATLIERLESINLSADAELSAVVDEMLEDRRAEAGFERFAAQWMPLRESDWGGSYARDDELSANTALLDDLRESALRFLRYAFLEADVSELFTSRTAYVNDRIAPLFGVAAPGSETLVPVELPDAERAGILTHPAVLATAPADATFYSIYRGVMIMNKVLCIPPGLPDFSEIDVSEGGSSGRTSREKLEEEHLDDTCRGCHQTIDGIGFAFGNYDSAGRYRSEEFGFPIDATGVVLGEDVDDAIGFAEALVDAPEVHYCLAEHLYTYAVGRAIDDARDLCQVQWLADTFEESSGELRGLARTTVLSGAFRYFLADEVSP